MTPGEYIGLRLEGLGLGTTDLEHIASHDQEPIEAAVPDIISGAAALTLRDAAKIASISGMDISVMALLALKLPVQICVVCGCTDNDPCVEPCWWTAIDLCSSCQRPAVAA